MTVKTKNLSEQLLEQYLQAHNLTNFEHEPTIPGKSKKPDYRLVVAEETLFLEVKEFQRDSKQPLPQGAYDPYVNIREKINAAREKFVEYKDYCCCLVLYNVDSPLIELSDTHIVLGSMLGDLGMTFQINTETGAAVSEPEWAFTKRGKMIDYKNKKPQNTTLSAIVALDHLPIGKRRLERELDRQERERGRALELEEFLEFAESLRLQGLDSSLSVLRAIVYENPYARIPLRRDIFVGNFDERFGPIGEGIGRLYVGEELQALEKWESEK